MFRLMIAFVTFCWTLPLYATTFVLSDPQQRIVGHNLIVYTHEQDTLLDIARRFDLGYDDIVDANPHIDPWIPGADKAVLVPTRFILPDAPKKGIVINLAELRLYYYPKHKKNEPQLVITHPIGIGREGWATPLGQAHITQKIKDPSWTPPASIKAEHLKNGDPLPKVIPAGPDNPLGAFAMRLSIPGYLLHGTNKPFGVGMRVSHGCIRLFPEDIQHMFGITPVDTYVNIVYQPYKAAVADGHLYLEANEVQEDIDKREGNNMTPMVAAILGAQNKMISDEDWPFAEKIVRQHLGVVKQLNQNQPDIADNVWFVDAGLQKAAIAKMTAALDKLKLENLFWPLKDNAKGEMLLGPFKSRAEADATAQKVSQAAGIRLWTVQLPKQML